MAIQIQTSNETKESKSKNSLFDFLNKDIPLFGTQLSDKKKELFFASLHTLIDAGVSMAQVLETILQEQEKEKGKVLIQSIIDNVIAGHSLSVAIQKTNQFSNYEYFSLKIGEETGRLSVILKELQVYYAQKVEQKRKLIGALMYPIVVLSVAFVVVAFMLQFIVPMFADIFKRFGGDLPWITKQVLAASNFFKGNFVYILIVLFIITGLYLWQRKQSWFVKIYDSTLLYIPVLGTLLLKIYLARFCKSMSLLAAAKIPLVQSLDMVKQMIVFYPLEQTTERLKQGLLKGQALHITLAQEKIIPNKVTSLVKIGEEVNQLDLMFDKLASQYQDEINYQIQVFNSLLEPILIIFLAIVIGVILVAMYLPIFQLSTEML